MKLYIYDYYTKEVSYIINGKDGHACMKCFNVLKRADLVDEKAECSFFDVDLKVTSNTEDLFAQ